METCEGIVRFVNAEIVGCRESPSPSSWPSGSLAPARSALCGPTLVRIPSDGSQPSEVPWGEGEAIYAWLK